MVENCVHLFGRNGCFVIQIHVLLIVKVTGLVGLDVVKIVAEELDLEHIK